jgi:Transposase DDE domain group 1
VGDAESGVIQFLLPRELDKRLGLDLLIAQHLMDPRSGHNRHFPLPDLFGQSIYSRPAGYADTNDAERLTEDPTFRMLASRERRETSVALTSTLHWFETRPLFRQIVARLEGLTWRPTYSNGRPRLGDSRATAWECF